MGCAQAGHRAGACVPVTRQPQLRQRHTTGVSRTNTRPSLMILGEREETLFVVLLRNGDIAHHAGDFGKTFRVGDIRKRGIHFSIFVMFTGSGGVQVGFRARDDAGREGGGDFHVAAFQGT